jgi:pimeloyl-ACP methyl ester carboxylesterase
MKMTQSYLPTPCGKCAAKLNSSIIVSSIVLLFSIVLSACDSNSLPEPQVAHEEGQLYGHSAGGQFTGRFLVTHPGTVKKAVITSAATYPQPNTEVAWPFGMGELQADIEWDSDTIKHLDIMPDKQKWLAATEIPLTVIVGLDDTAELPSSLIPGQKRKNRYVIAQNWIQDMVAFAEANGLESRFKLEIIPGQGHSMSGLISYSQEALVSE